jgi:hypothetical protein
MTIMNKQSEHAGENMARLHELLSGMNLPPARLEPIDVRWLLRNISINNWNHPDLAEAIKLLKSV